MAIPKPAVEIVTYGAVEDYELIYEYRPYTDLERVKLESVLRSFVFGFNVLRIIDENAKGKVHNIGLEEYVSDFIEKDLPSLLGFRVNLDEVDEFFRQMEVSIYLVAMPRCHFQSFRDSGFTLDRNGVDVRYGLKICFDADYFDHLIETGPYTEEYNSITLRECGFYKECMIS